MQPQIRVDVSAIGDVVSVAAFGEIDLSTAPGLQARALEAADVHRPSTLALDLRGVSFLDSTGLRLLMVLEQAAKAGGYRFKVVRGPASVQRVLDIAGLTNILEFVHDPVASDDQAIRRPHQAAAAGPRAGHIDRERSCPNRASGTAPENARCPR